MIDSAALVCLLLCAVKVSPEVRIVALRQVTNALLLEQGAYKPFSAPQMLVSGAHGLEIWLIVRCLHAWPI